MSVERHYTLGIGPAAAAAAGTMTEKSAWQSPVTYLFGGLAAMLGLIAIALVILACSYWRQLSRDEQSELEKGDAVANMKTPPVYEEKIVVIMPGDDEPTYLANPVQIFQTPTRLLILSKLDCSTTCSCTTVIKEDDIINDQHHNNDNN
ncbi:hypothetical protein RND81_10G109900 [Saponaria officinalis]|uniref:Uncharacterized protein n=1 Tax=Saponaria officinalis TaxID=3572 RepID=A0AAW1I1J5_SAPOF